MAISERLGERRTVRIAAGALEYRESGSGPAVAFVHGAAVNGDLWRHVAPELAGDHRCIVPDLPLGGHTLACQGDRDMSLFGLASILDDFLAALDLSDATLVANDTGGAISQALVCDRPGRVRRLVLTSCDAFDNYPPRAVAYLKPTARVAPAFWLLIQSLRAAALQRLPITYGWATHQPIEPAIMESFLGALRTDAGVRRDFARVLRAADRRDMRRASEGVGRFEGPALVVWADGDKFFPREHGRRLAQLLPRGRFELVERSRTFIPEDNPARLVELLADFLAEPGA